MRSNLEIAAPESDLITFKVWSLQYSRLLRCKRVLAQGGRHLFNPGEYWNRP